MKKMLLILMLILTSIVFSQQANELKSLEIHGTILNDTLVECSVFEIVEGEMTLLDKVLLDKNYYYTNLDFYKTYVILFEGTYIDKYMYVQPEKRKLLEIDINFSNTNKRHCFIVLDEDTEEYIYYLFNNEELKELRKEAKDVMKIKTVKL